MGTGLFDSDNNPVELNDYDDLSPECLIKTRLKPNRDRSYWRFRL